MTFSVIRYRLQFNKLIYILLTSSFKSKYSTTKYTLFKRLTISFQPLRAFIQRQFPSVNTTVHNQTMAVVPYQLFYKEQVWLDPLPNTLHYSKDFTSANLVNKRWPNIGKKIWNVRMNITKSQRMTSILKGVSTLFPIV